MHWHEIRKNNNQWLFPAKKGGRVAVCFRGENVRKSPFEGYFLRFEGDGEVPGKSFTPWEENPENWFELWPLEPMFAFSAEEAKSLFQPILPQVEDRRLDTQFTKKPYVAPIVPKRIKDIEHLTHLVKARIVQLEKELYQIGYAVYSPDGRYFPVSTPSFSTDIYFEWGVTYTEDEEGNPLNTMADTLASAEEIAAIELDLFVMRDSEIQRRSS